MIAVAIVPLLLTAATAATMAPDPPSRTGQDQAVQVRLDEGGDYYPGHDAQVDVRTEYDGYLLVLHVDPAGRLRVLFPLEPFDDAFVEGGKKYELVNRGGRGSFYVGDVDGIGAVFAAHSDWPFHLNAFAEDHRWDYQALVIPPEGDVETALVDLVAKVTYDGWFEYDLVEYEVYGEGSYASGPRYRIHADTYIGCCQPAVGVSVFVGPDYYYPYGYPWYFSSYWYYPSYHYYAPYYVHRPSYAYPFYRGRYHPGRHYAGGYPRRDYRFKPPYRYDRNRSQDQYRPRVGVDAGRHAFGGGGSIDYRGRRSPSATPVVSPRRRTVTPVATAGGSTGRTRPSGRVGSRRTGGTPLVADRSRTAGRSPGRVSKPRLGTAGRTRPQPGGRAGAPARRNGTTTSGTASRRRSGGKTLGGPVLKPLEPKGRESRRVRPGNNRPGRTARSGRPPSRKQSPPRAQRSNGRTGRSAPPPRSRPQARSGGGSRRSAGARAPTRSKGSRRRP